MAADRLFAQNAENAQAHMDGSEGALWHIAVLVLVREGRGHMVRGFLRQYYPEREATP